MPQAVTHILVPLFLAALFRDWYIKRKNRAAFPLHYVVLAAVGGAIPDSDIFFFWIVRLLGFPVNDFHRGITHTLIFFAIFLVLAVATIKFNPKKFGKHKLHLWIVFVMIAFGILTHIALDMTLDGTDIKPFYPFDNLSVGINLAGFLPSWMIDRAFAVLDGIVFILWLIYLEWKHKISDVI